IQDLSYDVVVGMAAENADAVARFDGQIRIENVPEFPALALRGDSGSLVVDGDRKAVGLFFAGPLDGSYGIANHIEDVLAGMQIELVTEEAVA
ncbi:MAG TPA: hypothetical protein VM434_00545, partial [Beijerinckiaceae bacterium]|nr:hypothetical protein [Beijerinckiaceae bacterium]